MFVTGTRSIEGSLGRVELRTERLLLRRWRPSDREPFARLNADPHVMRHFERPLMLGESDAMVDRIDRQFDEHGFGLWAVEIPGHASFIGFTGLWIHSFTAHFMPAVEIGWRLDSPFWGRGYATEAARAALADGFERVGLREIVSFTSPLNVPSIRVMERIGMTHDPTVDFDHPNVSEGHPLKGHVLYRLAAP
jgi:ribosomal-protein-alanine N-acetyltransferase